MKFQLVAKIDVIDNSRGRLDFILNNKIQDNSNVFQFNNTAGSTTFIQGGYSVGTLTVMELSA